MMLPMTATATTMMIDHGDSLPVRRPRRFTASPLLLSSPFLPQ
jgi:hypothetical protein